MEPSSLAQALTVLGASLVLAKLLEEGAIKLRLPGVLGQILAGIILGSSFSYFRQAYNGDALEFLMNLGLIWLLFLGGLETDISLVRRTGKVAVVSTTMGVLVPLILGFLVGRLLGLPGREPLVLGILLTPTSIGLTLRVFIELGKLNTDYGIASLTASILDDFMGIALLVLGVARGSPLTLAANFAIFVLVCILLSWAVAKKLVPRIPMPESPMGVLAITAGLMLLFSAVAQYTISAAIEGAYLFGLFLGSTAEGKGISESVKVMGEGLLIPSFFVMVGGRLELGALASGEALLFTLLVLAMAVLGKVAGRGLGALIAGFDPAKSLVMGVGSIPRLEIAMVIVITAASVGSISPAHQHLFLGAAVAMVLVTNLVTPPLLKWSIRRAEEKIRRGKG